MTKVKIHIIKKAFLLVFSVIIWISCTPTLAPDKAAKSEKRVGHSRVLENIKKTGILRVGVTGDFMPFSYMKDTTSGVFFGIDIEMAKNLAKSLGVKVQFIKTSWPDLMNDLNLGKFDIGMSGITITPKRQKLAYFSNRVYSGGKAAITRDENVSHYNTIEAINSKDVRVIVNPGGTNESFAIANFPKAILIQNDDNLSIFQKIVDGEADVMVTDAIETLIQERLHPELEAVNPDAPFNSFSFGYLLPKDSIFKENIDQWLVTSENDLLFQKIFNAELNKIN